MKETLIFLSHSSSDKKLADQFKNLLVMGFDLRRSNIFYTSNNATGIPIGVDGNQYMQEQLKGAEIIISLITPSFYESAYCMCELGYQSHLKDVIVFPIVFSYMELDLISSLVKNPSMHHIRNRNCLDHLADSCQGKIENFSMSAWDEASKNFISIYDSMEEKIAIKHYIEKSPYDEWSTILSTISKALFTEPEEKGLLSEKGFGRRGSDGYRNMAFTSDGESTIVIDICRDGHMLNSPYSKATHNLNLTKPLVGLITVMAPPPSTKGEKMPDMSNEGACAYRYINWWESDGVDSVLSALDSIIEEINGEKDA